jgi:hypothetical protein
MPKLGYVLMIVGFAWIAGQQIEGFMKGDLRAVVLQEYARVSPDRVYADEYVRERIRMAALAAYRTYPPVLAPGLLMLIGGLLLGRSRRGTRSEPTQD